MRACMMAGVGFCCDRCERSCAYIDKKSIAKLEELCRPMRVWRRGAHIGATKEWLKSRRQKYAHRPAVAPTADHACQGERQRGGTTHHYTLSIRQHVIMGDGTGTPNLPAAAPCRCLNVCHLRHVQGHLSSFRLVYASDCINAVPRPQWTWLPHM